jgi:filamentous hemagglutinin family protein
MGNPLQNIRPLPVVGKTFTRRSAGHIYGRHLVLRRSTILLMAASLFLSSIYVHADVPAHLPTDPTVAHGTAVIHTVGDHMTVTNSPNAILNWQDFSIGSHQGVYFQQDDITSQVLNRVMGNDPSQILGSLGSNGGVWLINPQGILFGPAATVNVAGLVASTLDISNLDFLAGKYSFGNGGGGKEQVTNQGEVRTTFGGRVWLLGAQARNEGTIQAPGGNIVLAAGKSMELIDSGAPNIIVRVAAPENEVANLGKLVAANGGSIDVHGSIVNQGGIIRADSTGIDPAGRIVLKASDNLILAGNSVTQAGGGNVTMVAATTTYLAGLVDVARPQGMGGSILLNTGKLDGTAGSSLDASGGQGGHIRVEGSGLVDFSTKLSAIGGLRGGIIEVTGDQVYLRNADVDGSGGVQGGTVHVGGGWQGGGNLPHARQVLIDAGSQVKAGGGGSTSGSGKGGEIAIWSTQSSQHYGLLQAKDGGRIEFSSRGSISTQGDIQVGTEGSVLFDPKNLIIDNPPPQGISIGGATFASNPSDISNINPATITAILNRGNNVTLQANNDIFIRADINAFEGGRGGDFVLQAGRNISFEANITTDNGNLTAVAGDSGANVNNRDLGTPTLTITPGVSLNVGNGTATLAARGGNFINSSGNLGILTDDLGRWLVYATDPATSTEALSGYDKHYNQPYPGIGAPPPAYAGSGNWFLYSVAPVLLVSPVSQPTAYPASPISTPTSSGFIDGDTEESAGVSGTPTWAITGPTSSSGNLVAGPHEVAYVSGLISALGYQFVDNTSSSNELTILPRLLLAVGTIAENKVYDGTTTATLSGGQLFDGLTLSAMGVWPGDSASLSGATAVFENKNVGNDKIVNLSTISLTGVDAVNYRVFSTTNTTADITPLAITGSVTVANKTYDATTAATITSRTLGGVLVSDVVSYVGGTANFSDKNVGVGKTVTATGLSLSGLDAANYTVNSSATTLADIIALAGLIGSVTAANKTYDATTVATITSRTLSGVLVGDVVRYIGGAANFSDKNVGVDKTVTATGLSLSGTDAGNYAVNSSATTLAEITPRPLIGSVTAADKRYDATTAATLTSRALSGVLESDVVSYVGGIANFSDKDVGLQTVTATGLGLAGADAGNYTVNSSDTARARITPAMLTYVADPTNRLTGTPIVPPPLTGRVTGFLGSDTLDNDTVGTPFWTTPANAASPAGVYAINGDGLSARNYTFQQAASNATALTLLNEFDPTDPRTRLPIDNSTHTNRALAGALPLYDQDIHCRVNDRASLPDPDYGIVTLASMSREEMEQLVVDRKERKRGIFADALCKLEGSPRYADVPSCRSLAETDSGQCKVTDAQIEEYLSRKEALAEPQPSQGRSTEAEPQATKRRGITRLPQIERKFTVLFGIDQYSDPAIPALENAISDAEVVGTLLAEKLGYEVRVARNATKADIVRTMNRLALEMRPHDSVTIYYAGHGYLDEKTGSGYWIPADASTTDPRSWISNTDISRMLSLIRSNQVVMISDSCYSGAFAKEQKISLEGKLNPDEVLAKRSVVVMSSGGDEPVADSGRENHSIFAWYLMEALRNVDNWEPGTNLFQQVQREVRKAFPQTPQYGGVQSAGNEKGADHLFEFRQLEQVQ